jgi:phosphoserine phosphatase
MNQLNLPRNGDSITDLPMAKEAGLFIVFNPKDEIVKEKADVIVEKKIKRLN